MGDPYGWFEHHCIILGMDRGRLTAFSAKNKKKQRRFEVQMHYSIRELQQEETKVHWPVVDTERFHQFDTQVGVFRVRACCIQIDIDLHEVRLRRIESQR